MASVHLLMRRFSIRVRMLGAIAMVLALFALVGAAAFGGGLVLRGLNAEFIDHSLHELQAVAGIRKGIDEVQLHEKNMVIDYENGVEVLKHREAWAKSIEGVRKGLGSLTEGEADEDNVAAGKALESLAAYEQASVKVLANIQDGAYDNAKAADRQLQRAKQHMEETLKQVDAIAGIVDAEVAVTNAEFHQAMTNIAIVFGLVLALVVVAVVPLTLINSRSIQSPIDYARRVAGAVAAGDLTMPIRVEGQDEASELLQALSRMQDSLRTIVGEVRISADTITTASAEVATGNADLSSRTEQTAGHLQETASSMEQLAGTVRQSSDAAAQADQLAQGAAGVARRGGDVVGQVV